MTKAKETVTEYIVKGVDTTLVVKARNEEEARHAFMVKRYGDKSDHVTPRKVDKNGVLEPYKGHGLTVIQIT